MSPWWRAAASTLKTTASASAHHHFRRHLTIEAIPRELSGTRCSLRERDQGRIPTVVFAQTLTQTRPDDPTSICASAKVSRKMMLTTEMRQIKHILSNYPIPHFCSTTYPIQIRAGPGSSTVLQSGKVLPIKVRRDEESGKILNLVLVWAEDGTSLKVDVPIVFRGEDICPGIKKGGFLRKIRPSLKFLGPAESIPRRIVVDLSNLDIGDKIYIHDVTVDPALKLLTKSGRTPICKICLKETTDNHEVTTDNHEVTTDNHEVTTDNHEVTTDNHEVATDNHEVATDNHKVAT